MKTDNDLQARIADIIDCAAMWAAEDKNSMAQWEGDDARAVALMRAAPAMRAALKSLLAELPELWGDRVHGGRIALALDEDAVQAALDAIAAADKGGAVNRIPHTYPAVFERFEIRLTLDQARSASQPGKDATEDVDALMRVPAVASQLSAIAPERIRAELAGCGAWSAEDLADDDENQRRILWIAAGNIREEYGS